MKLSICRLLKTSLAPLLLLSVISNAVQAQSAQAHKEIYSAVLTKLDNEQVRQRPFAVYEKISADILRDLNFRHPNYYLRDTSNFHLEPAFRQFLNAIKKRDINDSKFNIDFRGNKFRHLYLSMKKPYTSLVLSPIVISSDNTFAVCSFLFLTNLKNEMPVPNVCFLKRMDNRWVVVELIKLQ